MMPTKVVNVFIYIFQHRFQNPIFQLNQKKKNIVSAIRYVVLEFSFLETITQPHLKSAFLKTNENKNKKKEREKVLVDFLKEKPLSLAYQKALLISTAQTDKVYDFINFKYLYITNQKTRKKKKEKSHSMSHPYTYCTHSHVTDYWLLTKWKTKPMDGWMGYSQRCTRSRLKTYQKNLSIFKKLWLFSLFSFVFFWGIFLSFFPFLFFLKYIFLKHGKKKTILQRKKEREALVLKKFHKSCVCGSPNVRERENQIWHYLSH